MLTIATILFENFETLDVFGPIEVFGRFPEYMNPEFYSRTGLLDGKRATSNKRVFAWAVS